MKKINRMLDQLRTPSNEKEATEKVLKVLFEHIKNFDMFGHLNGYKEFEEAAQCCLVEHIFESEFFKECMDTFKFIKRLHKQHENGTTELTITKRGFYDTNEEEPTEEEWIVPKKVMELECDVCKHPFYKEYEPNASLEFLHEHIMHGVADSSKEIWKIRIVDKEGQLDLDVYPIKTKTKRYTPQITLNRIIPNDRNGAPIIKFVRPIDSNKNYKRKTLKIRKKNF